MGSTTGGAPARVKASHAKLGAIGKLTLPDGRVLDDVSGSDLTRELIKIGVKGASHEKGREANAKLYAAHLEEIARAAGDKAVKAFQRDVFQGTRLT